MAGRYAHAEDDDDASINELLIQMPHEFPGMAEKSIVANYNARYGLVYVRQLAWNDADLSPAYVKAVTDCQQDIRQALEYALRNTLLTTAYKEGKYDAMQHERAKRKDYSEIAQIGAMEQMAQEGRLYVQPGETWKTYDAMQKLGPHTPRAQWMKVVHDDRKMALLKLIVDNGDHLAWTAFHHETNFEDVVHQWNAKHPTQQFSLVTFMPASLKEYLEKKERDSVVPPPPPARHDLRPWKFGR